MSPPKPVKGLKERRMTDGEGLKVRFSIGDGGASEDKSPFKQVEKSEGLNDVDISEPSSPQKDPLPFQGLAANENKSSLVDRKSSFVDSEIKNFRKSRADSMFEAPRVTDSVIKKN